MSINDFTNLIRREVKREVQRRIAPNRAGVVSSYDPLTAQVKVSFPEDPDSEGEDGAPTVSGWMPWKAISCGAGWSAFCAPSVGTQATVTYLNGNPNSPVAEGALHSTAAPALNVPEGEIMFMNRDGVYIRITGQTFGSDPTGTTLVGHVLIGDDLANDSADDGNSYQALATEAFVLDKFNNHQHNYYPGTGTQTQTSPPIDQITRENSEESFTLVLMAT